MLVLFPGPLAAQLGNPFITRIDLPPAVPPENFSMTQDRDGVMLFANRQGLLSYNGVSWKNIDVGIIPTLLFHEPLHDEIYCGANGSYGILTRESGHPYEYTELSSDFSEIGTVMDIQSNSSDIYFLSPQTLSRVSLADPADKRIWRAAPGQAFDGMIVSDSGFLVHIRDTGYFTSSPDSLRVIPARDDLPGSFPVVVFRTNESEWMVCTADNRIYLYDGKLFRAFRPEDQEYLESNIISTGVALSESDIALGTYTGGCMVINLNTGKTNYQFNYRNGLPEDEIIALTTDRNQGLWLAQEYGLSRVDFSFPVRNYNIYTGLQGNLLTSCILNNELYTGTSEGVYYLHEVRQYREVEVWVRVKEPPQREKAPSPAEEEEKAVTTPVEPSVLEQEQEEEKPGFFRRLFGRKQKKEEKEEASAVESQEKPVVERKAVPATVSTKPRYERKKISTLESISHEFSRVEGLDAKCRQMIQAGNSLLAATNIGLYEIREHRAVPVIENLNIRFIEPSRDKDVYFAITSAGLLVVNRQDQGWRKELWTADLGDVSSLYQASDGTLWIGGINRVYRVVLDPRHLPSRIDRYDLPGSYPVEVVVRGINQQPFFFSGTTIYGYNGEQDILEPAMGRFPPLSSTPLLIWNQPGTTWLKSDQSWELLYSPETIDPRMSRYLWLFENIRDILISPGHELWVVYGNNQLSKVLPVRSGQEEAPFSIYFTGLSDALGDKEISDNQEIRYEQFPIQIHLTAPYFVKPQSTAYQYRMDPFMKEWSRWSPQNSTITFHNLPPGEYTLFVRARNIMGNISDIRMTRFVIHPPFYRKAWFLSLMILGGLLVVGLIIWLWTRKLQHDKLVLERKVAERTLEITRQKEEIESQRDELGRQRDQIALQKKEITDSILYASRIQSAILPPWEPVTRLFRDHFIIYIPRDIVSGDFYWFREHHGRILAVAADCTGHGVPGAFMSMLGLSALNDLANTRFTRASQFLNELRERVINALHQTGREGEAKDGMDISLCIIDPKKQELQYAGAFNPLYLIRGKELKEIKGDKMPIGIFDRGLKPFTNHVIKYEPGDTIYLFSDGFIDQFGGERERKYKSSRFRDLLVSIQEEPLSRQKELLEEAFLAWKGALDQVDDILIIGIRL